ncbi:MAG: hypothetical protein M0R17_05640 [Candidatus Omnitrophica bacterium]|jgi:hypothetical protein|nr:hypothetical protein [Candidatus Omnitrophota bacterium]
MKQAEVKVLVNGKKSVGKCLDEAYEEVRVLNESQEVFKQNKRELARLRPLVEKQDEQIKELKNKLFKLNFELSKKEDVEKVVDDSKGTLMCLRRIIRFMVKDKEYSKSELSKELIIEPKKLIEYLKFLNDMNIVKINIKNEKIIRQ